MIKFVEKIVDKTKEEGRARTSHSCYKAKEKESCSLKKPTKLHTIENPKKNSITVSSLRDDTATNYTRAMTNSFWKINDSRITNGL